MIVRNDATAQQVLAARPDSSTWLAANAGSGKTRVLTDRVARLLLDGVLPQNILCLTYTKAAASEMQNRLFRRLGRWTMLDQDALIGELRELGVEKPLTDAEINTARTLFARAIEAPGGLKIQTIHSFCAAILRRFPLEAGVNPQFTEIDERAQSLLLDEVVEGIADTDGASTFDGIAAFFTGHDLHDILRALLGKVDLFSKPVSTDEIWNTLNLRQGYNSDDLATDCFAPGDLSLIKNLRDHLLTKAGNDLKAGIKLNELGLNDLGAADLETLESVFLNKSGAAEPFSAKIGKFPTKKTQAELPFMTALEGLMGRVEATRQNRLTLATAERTFALHNFAFEFLTKYTARKKMMGFLDFDDLIQKTRELLSNDKVAAWVLFRLDGGIDHILVDEAQDTSPAQWDVIKLLAQEFTSGQGARDDLIRTIFVVGDKKQSIYSFQGADPDGFDQMKDMFERQLTEIEQPFQSKTLDYSFRSSKAILDIVDQVFRTRSGLGTPSKHFSFKENLPGRVDIWPVFLPPVAPEKGHWTDTVDEVSADHQDKQLADTLADHIKSLIGSEVLSQVDDNGQVFHRKVRPGDFLILVQSRQRVLFREIHRACKAAKLPIAGADRLKVAAELAVQDIRSLLAFLALPEDDLSLAEALRSPLFAWSEQDLYTVAHNRQTPYLWRSLNAQADDFPETVTRLRALRKLADFKRPFELIEHILVRDGGREALLTRLGVEAAEGIDALIAQALAYERGNTPSLTGFLTWLDADDLEIKRQMDGASDQIRVMTVHGAKGLEAPIVILPDTAKRNAPTPSMVVAHQGTAIWRPNADATPDVLAPTLKSLQAKQMAERDRLLYVALTRAESWLIVFGAGNIKEDDECWYNAIKSSVHELDGQELPTRHGLGVRYSHLEWRNGAEVGAQSSPKQFVDLPIWVSVDAPKPEQSPGPISPSDLGGAKVVMGADISENPDALEYGVAVHKLLEVLPGTPQSDWDRIAKQCVPDDFVTTALDEVTPLITNPDLQFIFADDTLAEVNLTALVPALGAQPILGTVDRLIVSDDRVLAVDFKTNQGIPNTPEQTPLGVLRQMGAYDAALAKIFPNHEIGTAILWTKSGELMKLPHHIVTQALQNTASA